MILHHGTTRKRAEAIAANGPDLNFREPGGYEPAGGFSTAPTTGPYPFGDPVTIARSKDRLFPDDSERS